jgi:hypothetical protein
MESRRMGTTFIFLVHFQLSRFSDGLNWFIAVY